MTTHDQHTEFTNPTDDREVLDYPAAKTNPAAAEADPRPTRREHAQLETEVPRESQAALETRCRGRIRHRWKPRHRRLTLGSN